MSNSCILKGNILGAPQIVGGCTGDNSNIAACRTPLSTIYGTTTTTGRKVVAISTNLTHVGNTASIPNVDFSFRPTNGGFYAFYYKEERLTLDLSNSGQLILPPTSTPVIAPPIVDFMYGTVGSSEVLQVRVAGNFVYSQSTLVPVFQPSLIPVTAMFVLGSRLATLSGGSDCLVPVLLSRDAYTTTSALPSSYCITQWSTVGVIGTTLVNYPLLPKCEDNTAPDAPGEFPRSTATPWTSWAFVGLFVLLLIILLVIALAIRRKEYVHDPKLPAVLAVVSSSAR